MLQPTFGDPLKKREQFGVSLRKKKKDEILKRKRAAIRQKLESSESKNKIFSEQEMQKLSELR